MFNGFVVYAEHPIPAVRPGPERAGWTVPSSSCSRPTGTLARWQACRPFFLRLWRCAVSGLQSSGLSFTAVWQRQRVSLPRSPRSVTAVRYLPFRVVPVRSVGVIDDKAVAFNGSGVISGYMALVRVFTGKNLLKNHWPILCIAAAVLVCVGPGAWAEV